MMLPGKLARSLLLLFAMPAWAATPAELEYALIQILAQEGALYLTYNINDRGKVVVLFGANEPDWRVKNTVKALQSHPDIGPGLVWSKTDIEFCVIR
jgi:hypothetical protein